MSTYNSIKSNGIGWRTIAPPCDTIQNSPWSRAFTKKICGNEMPMSNCSFNCCFTIVYQYRWLPNDLFELNVSGIFIEGPDYCNDCINVVFSHAYYDILVEISTKDPSFKNRVMNFNNYDWGDPRPTYDAWVKISTTAKCFNNGVLCDNGVRCCWIKSNITFNRNPNDTIPDYVVSTWYCSWNTNINYPCPIIPPDCSYDCWNSVVVKKLDTLKCEIPCNTGMWKYEYIEEIPITGCNGCSLAVYYRWRETVNCIPTFTDIELLFADIYGNCNFCFSSTNEAIKKAWRWLLLNAELPNPPLDSCITTYRAITAPCWKDENIIIVPSEGLHFKPCKDSACCWSIFEKCNIGDSVFTIKRIQSGVTYEPWFCYQYDSCNVSCDWLPTTDSSFVSRPRKGEENYVVNNNIQNVITCNNVMISNNYIDIILQNNKSGKILIVIYNSLGTEIYSESINKNGSIFNRNIDLSKFVNGLYFYRLIIDYEFICSGKILLIKE